MKELIEEWERNAERNEDDSFDFLTKLKGYDNLTKLDRIAKETHNEVFSEIDCTKCANCCKTLKPEVSEADIERIANFLNISKASLIETYLTHEENRYRTNSLPCRFLGEDDKCSIYEVRPTDCREFPHTDKNKFISRRYGHTNNTLTCPAVYHIVERMKIKMRWRRRR